MFYFNFLYTMRMQYLVPIAARREHWSPGMELQWQIAESHCIGAENLTQVLWKSSS